MENQKFNDVYTLIKNSNDRSAGVIAGALVEELLMELISASTIDDLDDTFLKEINGKNGPFRNFNRNSQIAYAFGLISDEEYIWLEAIRKIRNQCAHSLTSDANDINFSKPPLIDNLQEMLPKRWIEKLDKTNREKILKAREQIFDPMGAREMFNYLVALTTLALMARITTTEKRIQPPTNFDVVSE